MAGLASEAKLPVVVGSADMNYSAIEIGRTGPEGKIGKGWEYHIDTKFSDRMTWEDIRDRMDTLALKYKEDGRHIEFSNAGVAGQRYDLATSPQQRLELLQRAAGAHNHSYNPGFHSFDYYAPKIGFDRYHKSAEGAPIYLVGSEGRSAQGGSGQGYGNFAYVVDENDNVVSKTGHGDISLPVFQGGTFGSGVQWARHLGVPTVGATASVQEPKPSPRMAYQVFTAGDVVKGFNNNFDQMESSDLGAALKGAQEAIIQKRMDAGENFGGKNVPVKPVQSQK